MATVLKFQAICICLGNQDACDEALHSFWGWNETCDIGNEAIWGEGVVDDI